MKYYIPFLFMFFTNLAIGQTNLNLTGKTLGSSRFYDHKPLDSEIKIGYTFFTRDCWGRGINKQVKTLMLNYAFIYIEKVIFHIGAQNIRSQISIEKLGAKKVGEEMIAYYNEPDRLNFVYEMIR